MCYNPVMAVEIPGVDAEKGLELYDDDLDLYMIILRSYVTNTPAVLDALRTVTAENLAEYAATIHGIKGTSATIGAEETRQAAANLEAMAKAGDLEGVMTGNGAFLKQAEALVAAIRAWLEENEE